MARLRLMLLLLWMVLAIHAQRQMSVADLVRFVKSAIQQKNDDRQVADTIRKLKLTNKLDARTVEDLQSAGAGRQTMAALREMITATAALPEAVAAPPPVVAKIPPPSPADQKRILAEVTQNALDYSKNLPNFICNQVTSRYVDTAGSKAGDENWRRTDIIQEQLSYADGEEKYKVVLVNNLPVNNVSHVKLGGTTSSGEFGTMLHEIFDPETQTQFEWTRWATLRGRRMHVYNFRVLQANSKYTIHEEQTGRTIVAGYHGWIYADRDTGLVMGIHLECDDLENFPISEAGLDLSYDFAKIGDGEYLLPSAAELKTHSGRFKTWNHVEFHLYRKFGAEASIVFDTPDSLPTDQLKELPPKPDAVKQ
jgi:hypothetical protein